MMKFYFMSKVCKEWQRIFMGKKEVLSSLPFIRFLEV